MKLPAVKPYDVCQNCKAEMFELADTKTSLWWCPKCGTLATVADQWVPSGNWISVEDELPDDGKIVLTYGDSVVWVGYLDGGLWRTASGYPATVTHWSDMPEGPK